MTRALNLYKRKTVEELHAMREAATRDPANKNPNHANGGSIYLYTPKTHKLLEDIAWAIRYHMDDMSDYLVPKAEIEALTGYKP